MELGTSRSLHRLALQAIEAGGLEEAVLLLRSALKEDAQNSQAWNDLGVVMEILGNPTPAAECYTRALNANPFDREARANLVALELQAVARRRMKEQAVQIVMSRIEPAASRSTAARAISA